MLRLIKNYLFLIQNNEDIKKRKMKIERFFRTTPKPTLVENTLFFSILETILGFLFVFFLTTLFFFTISIIMNVYL